MRRMKLIINKVTNKVSFILAIRDVYPFLSLIERSRIIDNLPFIDEDMYMSFEELQRKIGNYAEYTYQLADGEDINLAPWERQEYLDSMCWYNSLSEEDKKRIDILVRANIPWD